MERKVLIINSKSPYPLYTGGEMRTFQMIQLIAQVYDNVDIAYLSNKDNPVTHEALAPYCDNSYYFRQSGKIATLLRTLTGWLTGQFPLQVYYFYSSSLQKWIDRNIYQYNIVFCNNIRTAEYVRTKKNVMKIIDFVDAISMNYLRAKEKSRGIWKLLYTIDYKRCIAYEQDLLHRFDRTMIISRIDRDFILSHSPTKNHDITVVSNMIDIPSEIKTNYNEPEKSLAFVGSMYYESNITAVCFFVEQVWDKIQAVFPGIKFYIVGNSPSTAVMRLVKKRGVIVTGFVENVEYYFTRPSIFVAPMLSGAGVQNKILQAMAAGCPAVTTTIGAEGIEGITEDILPIRDDVEGMANLIISLLNDTEKRKRQGENARKYITEHLSREVILSRFATAVS
ncbi:MAG: glycosyltransferase family 4 protein [Bacteroidales bacterium]|jgi:glycosyltransferase involved in cell wall biosynthesis|nr:glycosyltransferase family 4 protein [Bacteroidales bacterium]